MQILLHLYCGFNWWCSTFISLFLYTSTQELPFMFYLFPLLIKISSEESVALLKNYFLKKTLNYTHNMRQNEVKYHSPKIFELRIPIWIVYPSRNYPVKGRVLWRVHHSCDVPYESSSILPDTCPLFNIYQILLGHKDMSRVYLYTTGIIL